MRRAGLVAPTRQPEIRFVPLRDEDRDTLAAGLADNGRPPVGAAAS